MLYYASAEHAFFLLGQGNQKASHLLGVNQTVCTASPAALGIKRMWTQEAPVSSFTEKRRNIGAAAHRASTRAYFKVRAGGRLRSILIRGDPVCCGTLSDNSCGTPKGMCDASKARYLAILLIEHAARYMFTGKFIMLLLTPFTHTNLRLVYYPTLMTCLLPNTSN